jgi:hypothetical protein
MLTTTPRLSPWVGADAQAGHAQLAAVGGQHLGHHRHHLGGADVQADDEILVFLGGHQVRSFESVLSAGAGGRSQPPVVEMPARRSA